MVDVLDGMPSSPTIRIVQLSGEQMEIEVTAGTTLWDVMKIVRRELGVPKHEQVFSIETRVMRPFERFDERDICVFFWRTQSLCSHCSQPSRSWCKCRSERYCSQECQHAHWAVHRRVCRDILKRKGKQN